MHRTKVLAGLGIIRDAEAAPGQSAGGLGIVQLSSDSRDCAPEFGPVLHWSDEPEDNLCGDAGPSAEEHVHVTCPECRVLVLFYRDDNGRPTIETAALRHAWGMLRHVDAAAALIVVPTPDNSAVVVMTDRAWTCPKCGRIGFMGRNRNGQTLCTMCDEQSVRGAA